jgi:hypothetical protein
MAGFLDDITSKLSGAIEQGKDAFTAAVSSGQQSAAAAANAAKLTAEAEVVSRAVTSNSKSQSFVKESVVKMGGIQEGWSGFVSSIQEPPWIYIAIVVVAGLLGLVLWGIYKTFTVATEAQKTSEGATKPESAAGQLAAALEGFQNQEGFQSATGTSSAEDAPFVALQPMTIRQAGYLGPYEDGLFDPQVAVANALRAGFRSFVLQIDYMNNVKKGFAEPDVPTLVYRSDSGALLSTNSGSIQKVAESIASLAYKPEFPNSSKPVILYLHLLRTPSPVRAPEKYKLFLSQIATQLEPLAPSHLGMTPSGTFHRQKQEDVLLNVPLKALEGKTVILCNADTKIFRSEKATPDGERISPKQDLDFWVNMRVYLENENDTLGVTQIPDPDTKPAAVIVRASDLFALSRAKADAFAVRGRKRFVIALPSQKANPTPAVLAGLLNEYGVNMVPLDIFSEPIAETVKLVRPYEKQSIRAKPAALRGNVPA